MTNQSRRQFLKTGALFGAASAAAAVSAPAFSTEAPQKWDETTGLLIVGTGFAGCAAALEAHYLGAKKEEIMLVDKMSTPGGNSIINGGAVAAAGTDMQEKEGIKDSADLLFADIMKAGGGLCHPALARRIADESVANFKWLRDDIGVQFKAVTYHGGHSVKRSHAVTNNSGSGFILPMLAKLKEFGIEPRLRFIVDEIIVNDKKEVIGVKARQGYRFGRENSGKVLYVRATKGVLIAAGGFAQNVKYRMSQDPRLTDKFTSTNHPGSTGEMIMQAQEIGANTVQMDWIQLGPWTSPDEKGFGVAPLFVESCVGLGPMVDPATGKRFIKETGNRKVRADAIFAEEAKGLKAIAIANQYGADKLEAARPGIMKKLVEPNIVSKYDTLEALAKAAGIKADALKAQVEEFNKVVKAKADPVWSRYINNDQVPLVEGPWYVCELQPKVHHCMGGLVTDDNCEVLDVRSDKPIGHLFAAGEATGGVHGAVRLGSVAILDCLVFGRLAGQKVAAIK